jgi:hypothetical protein
VENILIGLKGGDQHPQKWDKKEQADNVDQGMAEQRLKKTSEFPLSASLADFLCFSIRSHTGILGWCIGRHIFTLRSM